ncbi:hypothetical protein FGK63_01150 [Ruegeria sediminis]|uniref:DUF3311 domain-containing protein n=1 Tax=Ruegeria sediminis TaxID=2583820 RepID=A0ABY2X2U5_9RHOB|nr:hypothetical protein [Ruegeria sediminis]TMV09706.1 hypothetical protein FGK63_01150 [Ruegeria sediminis]
MTEKRNPEVEPAVSPPAVFLERHSYRRRRLADAARLLPIIGAGLFAIPLLWPAGPGEAEPVPMSSAIIYIFFWWAALIVASAGFGIAAKRLPPREVNDPESEKWPR